MKRVALITGASAGIGYATAKKLARLGYHVLAVARREDRLQSLKAEIEKTEIGKCDYFVCDLRETQELKDLLESEIVKKTSVLVNNAGLARGAGSLESLEDDDIREVLETNLNSLIFLTKYMIPILKEQPQSDIVNLGSIAGRWTYPGGNIYNATKFGVRALSEGLRLDLLGTTVRVSNVEPGMVETEFSQVRFRSAEKAKSVYSGMNPLTPDDIAETIAWILERPRHVSIQELVIYPTDQASPQNIVRRNS
ncbi:MAG: SDR family NAD(P)-dependent oxidoreductase [Bdellovibrionales bacterium]|nr:SDR family NAD(P)-dependent oxidoreductase [Bdellovibrionales bacterium]